jgi:spermidine synthase
MSARQQYRDGFAAGQGAGSGGAELVRDADRPRAWTLLVDGAPQSHVDLDDPQHLEFEYMRRFGHLVDLAAPPGEPLRVLHLGGGGLTLARYVAATRPGSSQLAVEADAALVDLVRRRLPLAQRGRRESGGRPNADRPNPGHPNGDRPNPGHPNPGHPNGDRPNPGHPNPDDPNAEHPNGGHPNRGHPNADQPNGGHPNRGHPNRGRRGRVRVRVGDARAVLEQIPAASFDVVIADVFAGARTPAHLTSLEFAAAVARALTPSGLYASNVGDGPPLAHVRARAATVCSVFRYACMVADPAVLRGRRFGNLVLAAAKDGLPVAELTRRAAGDPFPGRLVHGDELTRFTGGAVPITDAQARPSPAPPPAINTPGRSRLTRPQR